MRKPPTKAGLVFGGLYSDSLMKKYLPSVTG